MTPKRKALISVYHKDGITEFAQGLVKLDFEIYASGGTAKHLKEAGIPVNDVATLVGGGAILGHRVVTLSREVHAGLLSRRNIQEDWDELEKLGIPVFDLVCVDLYPLKAEIAKPDCTLSSVIEQTDIGGPTMIRSAAKGQRIVICDPKDRQVVLNWLETGESNQDFVEKLCAKGEYVISRYCATSANYRSNGKYVGIFGEKVAACKYGENAWQNPAALFSTGSDDPLGLDKFRLLEGTPPSYNNRCDLDRALQTATHIAEAFKANSFDLPFIAVGGKHGNACGVAVGQDKCEVLSKMLAGDPLAIFGGVVLTNFTIHTAEAEVLAGKMLDAVITPNTTNDAIERLRRRGDKCRFLVNDNLENLEGIGLDQAPRFRYVRGGFLMQPNYTYVLNLGDAVIYGEKSTSEGQNENLVLAWAIGSTSNSNTITLVNNGMLIGNGVGQQDRVGAAKLAIERAMRSKHEVQGAVAYSDSFFPFPDGPQTLIDAGVSAIITSSGSVRDRETIDLCLERKVPLIMVADPVGRGFFGH
jgi:phosphoribosylaminoimidazolecarboxamide formyltransferase/IMP cyclohydrolase